MKKIFLFFILSLFFLFSWADTSGHTILPDGTIIQWGRAVAVNGSQSVYLDIPFPNGGDSVNITPYQAPTSGTVGGFFASASKNTFTLTSTMSGSAQYVNYIAIGH